VADYSFFFTIELSGRPISHDMLRELASRVLGQAGCGPDGVSPLVAVVEDRLKRGAPEGDVCRLQFVVHEGRLDISVTSEGVPPWKTSLDIS
jgi:hypothetical protein